MLVATFVYSMCFDALVLALMAWRLTRDGPGPEAKQRTLEEGLKMEAWTRPGRLRDLIFADGLIYFIIAQVVPSWNGWIVVMLTSDLVR